MKVAGKSTRVCTLAARGRHGVQELTAGIHPFSQRFNPRDEADRDGALRREDCDVRGHRAFHQHASQAVLEWQVRPLRAVACLEANILMVDEMLAVADAPFEREYQND
jgi:hypothetical protein